jgi:hypothetical protein
VYPSGESLLRVSYGVLNLTHRDGHEMPALLVAEERYRVRIQLNDAGSVFPAGHKVRLALSTTYWPMIWPNPQKATVRIFAGTLELPQRSPQAAADARLSSFGAPESAPPQKPTVIRRGDLGVEHIDRLDLELGTHGKSQYHPAQRSGRAGTYPDDVAECVADSDRNADTTVIDRRYVPSAGRLARLGRRAGSVSSQLGSLDSSRFYLSGTSCGHACHIAVAVKDIFTGYGHC